MIRAIIMEWAIGWNSTSKKKKDYVFMMCIIITKYCNQVITHYFSQKKKVITHYFNIKMSTPKLVSKLLYWLLD